MCSRPYHEFHPWHPPCPASLTPGAPCRQNVRIGSRMKVKQVICAAGRSGYMHRDLMAIKAGARQDGMIFHGPTVTPGFKKIVEPATDHLGHAGAGRWPDRVRRLRRRDPRRRGGPRPGIQRRRLHGRDAGPGRRGAHRPRRFEVQAQRRRTRQDGRGRQAPAHGAALRHHAGAAARMRACRSSRPWPK